MSPYESPVCLLVGPGRGRGVVSVPLARAADLYAGRRLVLRTVWHGTPNGSAPAPRTNWMWRSRRSTAHDYSLALQAAHRVVQVWPLSDYAPHAQYLVGRCLEAKGKDEAAFNAYQDIIEKYPKSAEYEDVLWRQYAIANRFLQRRMAQTLGLHPLSSFDGSTGRHVRQNCQQRPLQRCRPARAIAHRRRARKTEGLSRRR